MPSDTVFRLAETLSKLVLNFLRNNEIRRSFEQRTKYQYDRILRLLPPTGENVKSIETLSTFITENQDKLNTKHMMYMAYRYSDETKCDT